MPVACNLGLRCLDFGLVSWLAKFGQLLYLAFREGTCLVVVRRLHELLSTLSPHSTDMDT